MAPMMFPPDLSRDELYAPYVGETVYLYKPFEMSLFVCPSIYGSGMKSHPNHIHRSGGYNVPECKEIRLPNGYPFKLEKVIEGHYSGMPPQVECLGTITVRGVSYKTMVTHGPAHLRYKRPLPFKPTRD